MIIKGLIAKKIMMHQLFSKTGELISVTYLKVMPNIVTQVKTKEIDGYSAIQLSTGINLKKKIKKPQINHFKKANIESVQKTAEFKNMEDYNLGDKIELTIFKPGEIVDVVAFSKGKGTQGVIKRHGFGRGPMTHGSKHHRAPGSVGISRPDKVWKGQPLPGRMGNARTTIQNLEIIQILELEQIIVIKGSVPGTKNGWLFIKNSVKDVPQKAPFDLLYNSEKIKKEATN